MNNLRETNVNSLEKAAVTPDALVLDAAWGGHEAPVSRPTKQAGPIALEACYASHTTPQGAAVGNVARSPAAQTPGPRESATKALLFQANRAMNDREPEAVVTGLPAEVIDGLVEDMADAVVAMLLNPETVETVECDDESGDLRQV